MPHLILQGSKWKSTQLICKLKARKVMQIHPESLKVKKRHGIVTAKQQEREGKRQKEKKRKQPRALQRKASRNAWRVHSGTRAMAKKGRKEKEKNQTKRQKKNQARARAQCHGSNQEKTSNRIQCLDMQHVGVGVGCGGGSRLEWRTVCMTEATASCPLSWFPSRSKHFAAV